MTRPPWGGCSGAPESFFSSNLLLALGLGLQALLRLGSRLVAELRPLCFLSPGQAESACEGLTEDPLRLPPCPSASSPLAAFGALSPFPSLRVPSVLPAALDWRVVQTLHQLLHPGFLGVCTELGLGALLGQEPGKWSE